jgi:hypothetical protein
MDMQKTLSYPDDVDLAKLHTDLEKVYQVSTYLDFPFTAGEVADYFLPGLNISGQQLQELLATQKFADIPFEISGRYLLIHDSQSLSERTQREKMSAAKLNSAENFATTLAKGVPFIRTIAVTGSVAYGSAEKWDDIDLFIVTKQRRLWLSAFMMLVYVRLAKLFHLRPLHLSLFCLSYVHDELGFATEASRNMHSPLFAREILKAKPVAGKSNYRKLLLENNWVKEIYTKPYREKLSEFDRNGINGISKRDRPWAAFEILLDWAEGLAFTFLSRYLCLRAYLTNLRLKSEGRNNRVFEPKMSRMSCVYTSNFYEWLHALWGQ